MEMKSGVENKWIMYEPFESKNKWSKQDDLKSVDLDVYSSWTDENFQDPVDYGGLQEYYNRALGGLIFKYSKKEAIDALMSDPILHRGIIIQHFNKFYLFPSDADFNIFAERYFHGSCSVTEIIPRHRLRYPVFDLDTRDIELHDIICYFQDLFDCPRNKIFVFITHSGYHVLIKHCLVTFDENKELHVRASIERPSWKVDINAALHNIKLDQTRSYKPQNPNTAFKTLLFGQINLPSESLVCPTLIQGQFTIVLNQDNNFQTSPQLYLDETSLTDDMIKRISLALTDEPDQIIGVVQTKNDMVVLERKPGHFCKICQRRHGYNEFSKTRESTCQNCYVMCYSDALYIGCFRAAKDNKNSKKNKTRS